MPEWFRRTSWSPDDVRDFQARLRRSRTSFHKSQYLRIQAYHLAEVGGPEMLEAALHLLDQLMAEFPDASQLASALVQKGQCLAGLGQPSEAFVAFEAALNAERKYPRFPSGGVRLEYAELAVSLRRIDLYPRALFLIGSTRSEEPGLFPIADFRASVVRAFLAAEARDWRGARREAQLALEAAAKDQSPLRYHRNLGLVESVDPEIRRQLQEWSNLDL